MTRKIIEAIARQLVDARRGPKSPVVEIDIAKIEDFLKAASALGYDLVAREPTVVQTNAGADADDLRTGFETVKHIYKAMISAGRVVAE